MAYHLWSCGAAIVCIKKAPPVWAQCEASSERAVQRPIYAHTALNVEHLGWRPATTPKEDLVPFSGPRVFGYARF